MHFVARISIKEIFHKFLGKIAITWGLTIFETLLMSTLPLLIGYSIDGLLANDLTSFVQFLVALALLVGVAVARRAYDTRIYGTIRAELGKAQASRSYGGGSSVTNARVLMGRELADFMEYDAPESALALVQIMVAVVVLLSFHNLLAIASGGAAIAVLVIYSCFSRRFFKLNADINEQSEQQVNTLEKNNFMGIEDHFMKLRYHEVRLSDTETLLHGVILGILLTMLAFNLWFSATQNSASTGEIFSILAYSFELVNSAIFLPKVLQQLTRLSEITDRINQTIVDTT